MRQIIKGEVKFNVDDSIRNAFWNNVANDWWEENTFKIFAKFLDKNHSYIDLGAWIGSTVLYGCQLAKHCYAIEPDPIALNQLSKNIDLNPNLKDKISVFEFAAWDENTTIKLGCRDMGNSETSIYELKAKQEIIVDAKRLDDFIKEHNISDCNFIKMDVEGAEVNILPTIKQFLELNKPTLHLSLHHPRFKPADLQDIFKILSIYNYLYDEGGTKLTSETIKKIKLSGDFRIVATDNEWLKNDY